MGNFLTKIKETFKVTDDSSEDADDYLEISGEGDSQTGGPKVVVRPFVIEEFEDIKTVLDVLREGYTIPLINIRPLKEKDMPELRRAINKLKKTTEAIEGDIAGFGDDWIVVTPSFAKVFRELTEQQREENLE